MSSLSQSAIAVSVVSPSLGQTVSGSVPLTAIASTQGLVSLQFQLDGVDFGPVITSDPCSVSWDTTAAPDGSHGITAIGRDAQGASSVSKVVAVNVQNSTPVISGISAWNVTGTSVTISWQTNQPANSRIEYGGSPSYGSAAGIDPNLLLTHTQVIAGLAPNTTYHFRVISANALGGQASSANSSFTTASLSSPGSGAPPPTPPSGCTTPDPFMSLGGGTCIGGGWFPPGYFATSGPVSPLPTGSGVPQVSAGCVGPDPFAALGGGTCVNGGWLPPGMQNSWEGSVPPVLPTLPGGSGCSMPDPFAALGGGRCVNGGWMPPQLNGTPAPPEGSAGSPCLTPDPFISIPGLKGSCVNGGWVPVRREGSF